MVHKVPPDRKGGGGGGGGLRFDQNKGGSYMPMPHGRRQHHQQQHHHHQDDGYKAAAAAAIADMKQVLKKARSIKRISETIQAHVGRKQAGQFMTPASSKKKPSRGFDTETTMMMLTPVAGDGAGGWSGPNYMKATSSSDARIGRQQKQKQHQVSNGHPVFATPADKRHLLVATPKPMSSSKTPLPTSTPAGTRTSTTTTKTPKTLLLSRNQPSLNLVVATPATAKSLMAAAPPPPLFENISVSKATCSSTLKDSKFPTELELNPGGTQLEGTSVVRVCPYTYCSLNGHHHAPAVPLRSFLATRRRMIKAHKGVKLRRLPSPRKRLVVLTKDDAGVEQHHLEPENETSPLSTVLDERNDDDEYFLEIYVKPNQGDAGCGGDVGFDGGQRQDGGDDEVNNPDGNDDDNSNGAQCTEAGTEPPLVVCRDDVELHTSTNLGNGGTTTSYAEMNLVDDIIDRLSENSIFETEVPARFMEHDESHGEEGIPGADISCSSIKGDDGKHNRFDDGEESLQQGQSSLTPSEAVEVDCQEEMPEYAADDEDLEQGTAGDGIYDELIARDGLIPAGDGFEVPTEVAIVVAPIAEDDDIDETSLAFPGGEEPAESEQLLPDMDSESRTGFGINRKDREEYTDQLAEFNPRGPNFLPLEPEPEAEKVHLRHHMLDETNNAEDDAGTEAPNIVAADGGHNEMDDKLPSKHTTPVAEDAAVLETSLSCPDGKPARRAAKPEQPLQEMDSESRLKLIITRRSHEEDVEDLKDFNPREPNFLPLEPDPEAEKVDLRHQMMDDRKAAEEWMVDYALQRAVNKLGPARKKKVALLVEAFETVAPPPPIFKPKNPLRRHSSLGFEHTRPMQACS